MLTHILAYSPTKSMQACVAATASSFALVPLQASERGLKLVGGGRGAGLLLGRWITGGLGHKLFHHAQPSSMVFGWAGLEAGSSGGKDTCGRVPVVGRPARQLPGRVGVGWRPKAVLLP